MSVQHVDIFTSQVVVGHYISMSTFCKRIKQYLLSAMSLFLRNKDYHY